MKTQTIGDDVRISLTSEALLVDDIGIARMDGRYRVNAPYTIEMVLVSQAPTALDLDSALGMAARLSLRCRHGDHHRVHGILSRIEVDQTWAGQWFNYTITLVPRLWRLSQNIGLAVHIDQTIPDVLRATLTRNGLIEGTDFELRLMADYPERPFTLQYKESDLDFFNRLTEFWGLTYFFEQGEHQERLVLADTSQAWPRVSHRPVKYRTSGEKDGVYEFRAAAGMVPARMVMRDYDYRRADLGWQVDCAVAGGQGGTVVEFGTNFVNEEEGLLAARVRAESALSAAHQMTGRCADIAAQAGHLLTLVDHPIWDRQDLLVVAVDSSLSGTVDGQGTVARPQYEERFTCVRGDTNYRPPQRTPKPVISGVMHGVIEPAPNDRYAVLSSDGMYHVRLLVDQPEDQAQARPYPLVRMAQPHAGAGYGMHFPLRPGVEVIISFTDGDPDRPVIAGAMPNPHLPSPVTARNNEHNIIRTGGANEVNFCDSQGSQRIKMTTPHATTVVQLGAPNAPESGFWSSSAGGWTSVAGTTMSSVATVSALGAILWNLTAARTVMAEAAPFSGLSLLSRIAEGLEVGSELVASTAEVTAGASEQVAQDDEAKARQAEETLEKLRRAFTADLVQLNTAWSALAQQATSKPPANWKETSAAHADLTTRLGPIESDLMTLKAQPTDGATRTRIEQDLKDLKEASETLSTDVEAGDFSGPNAFFAQEVCSAAEGLSEEAESYWQALESGATLDPKKAEKYEKKAKTASRTARVAEVVATAAKFGGMLASVLSTIIAYLSKKAMTTWIAGNATRLKASMAALTDFRMIPSNPVIDGVPGGTGFAGDNGVYLTGASTFAAVSEGSMMLQSPVLVVSGTPTAEALEALEAAEKTKAAAATKLANTPAPPANQMGSAATNALLAHQKAEADLNDAKQAVEKAEEALVSQVLVFGRDLVSVNSPSMVQLSSEKKVDVSATDTAINGRASAGLSVSPAPLGSVELAPQHVLVTDAAVTLKSPTLISQTVDTATITAAPAEVTIRLGTKTITVTPAGIEILAGPKATITAAEISLDGNVNITGNLTVEENVNVASDIFCDCDITATSLDAKFIDGKIVSVKGMFKVTGESSIKGINRVM